MSQETHGEQPAGEVKEKPKPVKPNLYSYLMESMKVIAFEHGYNLVVHGSMNRDLDLIAIPWVDDPKPEIDLMNALHAHLNHREDLIKEQFLYNVLPGGRHAYVINLNRGGYRNYGHGAGEHYEDDPQFYIDISFTQCGADLTRDLEQARKEREAFASAWRVCLDLINQSGLDCTDEEREALKQVIAALSNNKP